jgi:predicted Zn-dependent peptidase
MKVKRLAWPLLCVIWRMVTTMTSASAQTSRDGEPFPAVRHTLPNGLRVWLQPRSDSSSVAALVVIRAGSRYEQLANNGVSHFVEHMLFAGTERWSEEEIKDVITRRGGRWNGWTSTETTTYFAQVSAQDFDLAMDWLAQVVFHPTFPADKVENERRIIFQERWGRYGWLINTLDSLGFGYELDRDVRRALFPGSTLGLRIVGEDESLDRLNRATLMSYYETRYSPENAVLVVVGNFASDQAFDKAVQYFGDVASPVHPAPPPATTLSNSGPHQVTVRGPMLTDQIQLMLGAQTVGRMHPDRWALGVLAEVLSQDLMREIRYRQGLVYGLGAYNTVFDDVGYFAISTTSASKNKTKIQATIEAYLDKVACGEADLARVTEAKVALQGRWALSMEDNVQRAGWLAEWARMLDDDAPIPDYTAVIEAVVSADLARVVRTYFTPQRRYVGLHQPVATVASGATITGTVIGLGVAAWLGRKLWRRRKRSQAA